MYNKDNVQIEEWMNDNLYLYIHDKELSYVKLPKRPPKEQALHVPAITKKS